MKSHEMLIDRVLEDGFTVSVHDGEEWSLKRSVFKPEILREIQQVDCCKLVFRRGEEKHWAFVVLDGDDPETVADYGDCEYMNRVFDEIDKWFE